MAVKFTDTVKHQKFEFADGSVLGFEGDRVEEYFINAGWAKATDSEPTRIYGEDEVSVDPETVFGTREHDQAGNLVLGGE